MSKSITAIALAFCAFVGLALQPRAARSEDEPVDIEVGSKRIGGPGTAVQQKSDAAWDKALVEDDMPMTEESLPAKGDKKRLPALHKLAKQYFGGKMWKDACDKYDQIIDEGGDEALALKPDGKANAGRSFFECGQIAFHSADYDKTERWLKKSERYAPADSRHAAIRRKIARESYRKAMSNRDVNGALSLFKKYQADQPNEDERIWMGEELSKMAWEAYQSKDKLAMKDLMQKAEAVAPMNTELRKLKEKIAGEEGVLKNLFLWGGLSVVVVVAGTQLSKWRGRQKVRQASGGDTFGDGRDEEV